MRKQYLALGGPATSRRRGVHGDPHRADGRFDGSASSDPDGTIASYAWDFGDGTQRHGRHARRTPTRAGTYTVRLTVTDNSGGTGTVAQPVTVQAPNQLPTAAFTSTVTGVNVSFDSPASNDPDGSIASYAWDFGDGATGTGVNPSHTYASSGRTTSTLTVIDNRGGTDSVTPRRVGGDPAAARGVLVDVTLTTASFDATASTSRTARSRPTTGTSVTARRTAAACRRRTRSRTPRPRTRSR